MFVLSIKFAGADSIFQARRARQLGKELNRFRYTVEHHLKHSPRLRAVFVVPLWFARKIREWRSARLLQHYSKVVKGGDVIIGPTNFPGKFKVSATSDLATRVIQEGVFEPELTLLLDRFSNIAGDIANIGANIGLYSVFFAKRFPNIRKVFAIEPNPEAIALLQWNVASNDVGSCVEILQTCIGEKSGQVEFAYIPGKSEYSSIGHITHRAVDGLDQQHTTVDVQPLSEALTAQNSNLSLIFIDAEGAEFLILKGAEEVIRRESPLLIFECEDELLQSFDHSSQMVDSYIAGLGYEVRDATAPGQRPIHPFAGVIVAVPTGRQDLLDILAG